MSNDNNDSSVFDVEWGNHDFDQLHTIAELLCDKKLTDCKFVVEGKTILAHRLVLAAASPFFLVSSLDVQNLK